MESYPIVPGRGLVSQEAKDLRLDYVSRNGFELPHISANTFDTSRIRNNIESFVGSVEIPLGLAGPLLFDHNGEKEWVHAVVGTLEGALVASMNRGAKVLSMSGGFCAEVIHQRMVRAPMFIFHSLKDCIVFKNWTEENFQSIKSIAEQYSNHASLIQIQPFVTGKSVHLKFIFTTGDASGQNMTTSCTWHAVLWMQEKFQAEKDIEIVHYVIEGNGASDKKVSQSSIAQGRGVHVVAECHIKEAVLEKVLRTSSADIVRCFNQSGAMSRLDGMTGYNINVANIIAAIFVATGQDLASIHESGCGILNVEQTPEGLYLSLNLPTLVIGTVGGGTHLSKQKEALQLMGCEGSGKLKRFAELIAGFALALEVSTYAAIVSGQFAKAHEKMGRNKPVNWLLKGEINRGFMEKCLNGSFAGKKILLAELSERKLSDNGIISGLVSKVSKKLTGFIPVDVHFQDLQGTGESAPEQKLSLLLKSKALDTEVIKGLHFMASAIDPGLSDLISAYREQLEYHQCHLKEIRMYELLKRHKADCLPHYYGSFADEKREIYILVLELLRGGQLAVFNSENEPGLWDDEKIQATILAITELHQFFEKHVSSPVGIPAFEPWKAKPLYDKLAAIVEREYEGRGWEHKTARLTAFIAEAEKWKELLKLLPLTIIHNDFSPRNIAIRKNGKVCIYDWELAMTGIPHRDVAELLSFVLEEDFSPQRLQSFLQFHYAFYRHLEIPWEVWKQGYEYALKEFLSTKVSFYLAGSILMNYGFAERIFLNAFRILEILEAEPSAIPEPDSPVPDQQTSSEGPGPAVSLKVPPVVHD